MSPESRVIFEQWSPPVFLTVVTLILASVYTCGWFAIRKTRSPLFPAWRLASFLLGLAIIWLSIASPLDGFADALLSAHMVEHLLLISFVPPLLLLSNPVVPLLRALPHGVTVYILAPFIRLKFLRVLGHFLTSPLIAWLAMNIIFLGWHIPVAYDFALEHERWHDFEHICFLGSAILFWWPIIRPWPTRAYRVGWLMLLYLASADVVNTALSAFLAFCDRPVYNYYSIRPNPFHISPMSDQIAGAVIMWVIGSLVFLVPVILIAVSLLQPQRLSRNIGSHQPMPLAGRRGF